MSRQSIQYVSRYFTLDHKLQPCGDTRGKDSSDYNISRMSPLWTMSVCTKFHGNPNSSCGDISVWTDSPTSPSSCCSHGWNCFYIKRNPAPEEYTHKAASLWFHVPRLAYQHNLVKVQSLLHQCTCVAWQGTFSCLAWHVLRLSVLRRWNRFVPLAETEEEGRWGRTDPWPLNPCCVNLLHWLYLL